MSMDPACMGRRVRRALLAIPVLAVLLAAAAPTALAAAPPGPYFNGFETNTAGWFNFSGATITRQPSGYTNGGGYADGIASASGAYHARLGLDPSPDTCLSGGGPQPIYYGPYTDWGGYSSVFPTGGYTTKLDIYLDVSWAQTHLDKRFDWSSAISNASGGFRRDFVFNAGTNALGFVISGGNNATRCGANPADPGHTPVQITQSGWYTFQHQFTGVPGGPLVVVLTLIQKSTNAVVGTWIRSDPSDIIGLTVGGNRYGWFVQNELPDLAIDNSARGTAGTATLLTLMPPAGMDTVGTQHCVTATVTDAFGDPVSGVRVYFSVPTSPVTHANPSSGSATTSAAGQATFCYTASLPGEDAIHAFADSNGNGTEDVGEPPGDATETWTLPASTSLCEVTITDGGWIRADNGDRSSFGGNAHVDSGGNPSGHQEFQDHGPAQDMNVSSTEITATTCSDTQATIYGEATIDGSGTYVFRIDVSDLGSPGTSDTYGIMLSNGYDSGIHPLGGGNITIH
jgi:hypothetical protein